MKSRLTWSEPCRSREPQAEDTAGSALNDRIHPDQTHTKQSSWMCLVQCSAITVFKTLYFEEEPHVLRGASEVFGAKSLTLLPPRKLCWDLDT